MKRALAFTLFASAVVGFAQQNKDPVSSVVKEILPHQEKKTWSLPSRRCLRTNSVTNPRRNRCCPPRPTHDGIEQLPLR